MSVARQVTLWISRVVNTPDEMTCPPPWESEATQEAGKQLVALFSYPLDRLSEGWGDLMRDEIATERLISYIDDAMNSDPHIKSAAIAIVAQPYFERAGSGDHDALLELGEVLWWDDTPRAMKVFQRAIAAGRLRGLLDLARLYDAVIGDYESALSTYQIAIGCADADISAEALVAVGYYFLGRSDPEAITYFQRAVQAGHYKWGPMAQIGIGQALARARDYEAAANVFRLAVEADYIPASAKAAVFLGDLLRRLQDPDQASLFLLRALESGAEPWAGSALITLVNMQRSTKDLDGLKSVYRIAIDAKNTEASYALDGIHIILNELDE
jgi:tetratricopeptide (TPR) repeat protein